MSRDVTCLKGWAPPTLSSRPRWDDEALRTALRGTSSTLLVTVIICSNQLVTVIFYSVLLVTVIFYSTLLVTVIFYNTLLFTVIFYSTLLVTEIVYSWDVTTDIFKVTLDFTAIFYSVANGKLYQHSTFWDSFITFSTEHCRNVFHVVLITMKQPSQKLRQ